MFSFGCIFLVVFLFFHFQDWLLFLNNLSLFQINSLFLFSAHKKTRRTDIYFHTDSSDRFDLPFWAAAGHYACNVFRSVRFRCINHQPFVYRRLIVLCVADVESTEIGLFGSPCSLLQTFKSPRDLAITCIREWK